MFPQKKGGLAFLFKKSWHTSTLANIERVWLAEQEHEREQKRIAQLRRDMEEQEQMRQLRQMHEDATGTRRTERLEWMYDVPACAAADSAMSTATAEQYLMGKEYRDPAGSELRQIGTTVGALFSGSVNAEQDALAKIAEDPLLAMRRREQQSLRLILDNPVAMSELAEAKMHELVAERRRLASGSEAAAKIERRVAKLLANDTSGHARRALERDDAELARKMAAVVPSSSPSVATAVSASAAPSTVVVESKEEKRHRTHHHKQHHHHKHHHHHHRRSRSRSHSRSRSPAKRTPPAIPPTSTGGSGSSSGGLQRYGLQVDASESGLPRREKRARSPSPAGSSSAPFDAREHRRKVRENKLRMTDAERAQALEQMRADGERREEAKHRTRSGEDDRDAADAAQSARTMRAEERPAFIAELSGRVYGTEADIADRIRRNVHRLQRSADD